MVEQWEKCKHLNAIWCNRVKGRYCILYSEGIRGDRKFNVECKDMEVKA